jgi:hypothetical protein
MKLEDIEHIILSSNNVWNIVWLCLLQNASMFSGVRVTRSLVLYLCFVDRCLSFCTFSFGHCFVCSSINGFWLALWYLQNSSSDIQLLFHSKSAYVLFLFFVYQKHYKEWMSDCYLTPYQYFYSYIMARTS